MDVSERYKSLLTVLAAEGVVLEPKATKWYWKVIAVLLKILSFGSIKFMDMATAIGSTIGTPFAWDSYPDAVKYEILLHEMAHVRQYRRFGFGSIWIGVILVGFAYLFLPFPVGLAYCRARLEQEGYEESIRAIIQTSGLSAVFDAKDFFVSQFLSANYLWMWPFKSSVEKWFNTAVVRIAVEEGVLLDKGALK